MKQLLRLLLLFAAVWIVSGADPAFAQSGRSVAVKQRDAVITLQTNGDADFVETWVVDFQRGSFTFAFREFPTNRLDDVFRWQVMEGDRELETRTDRTDEKIKFTWYFPDTNQGVNFFSDIHTFTLRYTVRGAMRVYPEGDQFWWKFVEADRGYPIESSRVLLNLPAAFPSDQIRATTYTNGDETGGARVITEPAESTSAAVEFLGGPFPSETEWEIRAQFPHVVTAAPAAWQMREDELDRIAAQNNLYAAVAGVLLLLGGPLVLLLLWYLFGRDKPTTYQAEYLNAPPDDIPPGVVGTLLDERADLQDIVATVADLARRGYLRIRESDGFGTPEYERTSKEANRLAPFEKATLDALLQGMKTRRLEDVRGSFYYHLKALEGRLYDEVVARGYFPHSPFATRAQYFKIGKWGALLTPVVGLVLYCAAFRVAPLLFFPLFTIELFFIGLLGLSRVMPQRTEKGAQAFAKWSAFRRYLQHIEKYTEVSQAADQFAKYLPYAVAFGLEKSWIEKFAQTSAPVPKWYVPYPLNTNNWSLPGTSTSSSSSESDTARAPGLSSTSSNIPIFSDAADGDNNPRRGLNERAPSLNQLANTSFVALNSVSSNMFDFLNTSASAFTEKPPARSAFQDFFAGVGDAVSRVGESSSDSSGSSSDRSWSSSSSSSSSWSGGGSSGGGGGGGGSSGFG